MTMVLDRPTFVAAGTAPRKGVVRFVEIPERRCFMVDGQGEPGGLAFQAAIGALYGAAYTLKFGLRAAGKTTRVGALEGLWTRVGGEALPLAGPATEPAPAGAPDWRWTLLIEIPPEATESEVASALDALSRKRPSPAVDALRVETFHEGPVVEALHVGPYGTEPETIARMLSVASDAGLHPSGPHHEIYLSDPRRTAPERIRTILRQPVA